MSTFLHGPLPVVVSPIGEEPEPVSRDFPRLQAASNNPLNASKTTYPGLNLVFMTVPQVFPFTYQRSTRHSSHELKVVAGLELAPCPQRRRLRQYFPSSYKSY